MILLKKLSITIINFILASLDVESLFIKIPLEETIKNCANDLFSNNFYSGKLSRKDLHDLLKLATTESSFIFKKILFDRRYDEPLSIYSRLVGMTI